MNISKITLGTAQLGLDYGISNLDGKPDRSTALEILKYSWEKGINTFDTAPLYCDSEEIIGSFISSEYGRNIDNIKIISKLPKIKIKEEISFDNLYIHIKTQINKSLKNLKIKKIPIYLLHHAPDIFLKSGLVIDYLNQIKNEGLIEKFGISAYNLVEVRESFNYKEINVIQIPINIFDHRLIKSGLLTQLKKHNYNYLETIINAFVTRKSRFR